MRTTILTVLAVSGLAVGFGCGGPGSRAGQGDGQTAAVTTVVAGETAEQTERMAWWRDARFGMFIHWGLYAVPAGAWPGKGTGHAEWIRDTAQIPVGEYEKLLGQFNPTKFQASEFVRIAQDAGMRYMVITSKHHDGFCLFDSAQTDWDIMSTPFKRDIIAELSAACRQTGTVRAGEKVGVGSQAVRFAVYHSIMDWHHPDYLPRRPWEKANRPEAGADFERFNAYLKAQLLELAQPKYDPGIVWFDGEWEQTWTHERGQDLARHMRKIAPKVIFNNRIDKGRNGMEGNTTGSGFAGDYDTPEQTIPTAGLPGDWETCMTMNNHWGYNASDKDFKTSGELISKLCEIASGGGNFLLNVGPTAEGLIPPESVRILGEVGQWMRVNGEAIYGTARSPFAEIPAWGRVTAKRDGDDTILYLHVIKPPADGKLTLPGVLNTPKVAWLLQSPLSSMLPQVEASSANGVLTVDTSRVTRGALTGSGPVAVYSVRLAGGLDLVPNPVIAAARDAFIDSMEVQIRPDRADCQTHYTLDGSEPTPLSPVIVRTASGGGVPVRVDRSCTIRARVFKDGKPVTPVVTRAMRKVEPAAGRAAAPAKPGLKVQVYRGRWDALPNFDILKPLATKAVTELSTAPAPDQADGYALRFTGYVKIERAGMYELTLASDDGSRVRIGSELVVDHDGPHVMSERRGSVALGAGWHPITVEMFQRGGEAGLKLEISGPGLNKQPVAGGMLGWEE